MTERDAPEPSLLEKIIADTFQSLETSDAFNANTLRALRELANTGKLSHAKAVEKVLKRQTGEAS